ncbi:MAG: DUF5060 domain-containing protein [Acidobacteriota bacterium]
MTLGGGFAKAQPGNVSFSQSASSVNAYDFVEVTVSISSPDVKDCFTGASLEGHFQKESGPTLHVDGFCDSGDGSIFRIRFMPESPGRYSYSIVYRQGAFTRTHNGEFTATDGHRRGIVRVDPKYPWHFIWSGTGEHYFWNGTTTYWLEGWRDEKIIFKAIDRLHSLKVNRMRVLLAGRASSYWGEPIVPGKNFTFCLNPWVAEHPNDVERPEFDYTRFNIPYWHKYEHMLRHARGENMIISVIFDIADSHVHPTEGSADELRYFRYGIARLAAFSNVTWDLGNEFDVYHQHPNEWANMMGSHVKQWDPYNHLTSAHPTNDIHVYRKSSWFDMTLQQYWGRPLHHWMLNERREQAATGRIIPQVNEEYGYEDHYPSWSPNYPDGQSADANRRAAWEMSMAGGYQTTGETAKRGTNVWPNTGGGWINGRGDSSMVMLRGYAHMVDFFTSFDWWKANPHDELVNRRDMCLAEPGKIYALYLPMGGRVTLKLAAGTYRAEWFNPRNGGITRLSDVHSNGSWTSPEPPDGGGDWALLLIAR